MRLELKHLVPYLPYSLYTAMPRCGKIEKYLIYGFKINQKSYEPIIYIDDKEHGDYQSSYLKAIKPLLKPLSIFGDSDDLRKVHEFIGLGNWCDAYDDYFEIWFNDLANVDKLVLQAPQEIFDYFLANHYDVFGLIKKGLATTNDD